jgi:hypothetical protein
MEENFRIKHYLALIKRELSILQITAKGREKFRNLCRMVLSTLQLRANQKSLALQISRIWLSALMGKFMFQTGKFRRLKGQMIQSSSLTGLVFTNLMLKVSSSRPISFTA